MPNSQVLRKPKISIWEQPVLTGNGQTISQSLGLVLVGKIPGGHTMQVIGNAQNQGDLLTQTPAGDYSLFLRALPFARRIILRFTVTATGQQKNISFDLIPAPDNINLIVLDILFRENTAQSGTLKAANQSPAGYWDVNAGTTADGRIVVKDGNGTVVETLHIMRVSGGSTDTFGCKAENSTLTQNTMNTIPCGQRTFLTSNGVVTRLEAWGSDHNDDCLISSGNSCYFHVYVQSGHTVWHNF